LVSAIVMLVIGTRESSCAISRRTFSAMAFSSLAALALTSKGRKANPES
jgi:hypothetical protein